jgi:hypothetical protein
VLVSARFVAFEVKATRSQRPSTATSKVRPLAWRPEELTEMRLIAPLERL